MAKIRDLPLEPIVRGWLREERFRTSDDLWRAVGPDFQEGLVEVNRKTRIAPDRLIYALGAAAAAPLERRVTLGEVFVAAALLALALLGGLRIAEALGIYPFPLRGLTAETDQMVVVPRNGLPAFHVLAESDLHPAPRPRTAGGITRKTDALGHYLLRPLSTGSLLRLGDLSSVRLSAATLAGRRIVTLHIDPSVLGPQVAPGTTALLFLSPRQGVARPAVEVEVLMLAVEKGTGAGPAMATVAVASERGTEVAAALGSSEVYLARVVPSPGATQQ